MSVHKAEPTIPDDPSAFPSAWSECAHCGLEVQRVPKGSGVTVWVHSLTGAVAGKTPKPKPTVYVIHGVADRDHDELVCMFFPTKLHADEFALMFPGRYEVLEVSGVVYHAIEVEVLEPLEGLEP